MNAREQRRRSALFYLPRFQLQSASLRRLSNALLREAVWVKWLTVAVVVLTAVVAALTWYLVWSGGDWRGCRRLPAVDWPN